MHIPDGYLSPIVSIGLGAATVPGWAIATRRVQAVLSDRTIPLLAIFSALSFTIMMFNIPVPGGTTAHGVGGTLAAIVLGPWAAVIVVSVALIIQALFFGDGGVLAIFANCLNMGFVLPFAGYLVYRVVAGRSSVHSSRRVWAAGIGAYVGITLSAVAVAVELGVQPLLFSENGHALYSPYGLPETLPAMLVAHLFGASIVEALLTAFGLAWLQQRHPGYLGAPGATVGDGGIDARPRRSPYRTAGAMGAVGVAVFLAAGLVSGGGDPSRAFGANWRAVDWPSVGAMLVVVGAIAAVLLPVARLLLPARLRGVGLAFTAAAVLAPLGLIAPGFAYGEGSTQDVANAFGYVPSGLHALSTAFSAPFAGYRIPLPFLSDANPSLWQQAIGYEIAGIVGILALGLVMLGLGRLLGRGGGSPRALAEQRDGRIGWVEQTMAGITGSIERAVFSEEHARAPGWLQRVDPRAKLGMFLALVLAASLSSSVPVLLCLYGVLLVAARASRIPFEFYVRRVWLGIPFFAGLVVLPSIFFVPGPRLFELALGPIVVAPSIPGLAGAVLFIARVGVSVSLAVLLVVTTRWADVLKSLAALRVPGIFILILAMAYRYIFLFLRIANGMFEARKSRTVARTTGGEQRRWISGSTGNLLNRSFRMSNDVYASMVARGFGGTMRSLQEYRMRRADWAGLAGSVGVAVAVMTAGSVVR